VGAHPLFSTLSRRGLNPIQLAYSPSPPDNGLGQYVSSPGNRACCYAELAVSSLAMAVIITSTHIAAEGWPGWVGLGRWLHTKMVYPFWRRSPIQVLAGCVGTLLTELIILRAGYVPTTPLYRNMSRVRRVFNIVVQHYMLRCLHLTRSVRQAALQVVNLAVSEKYEGYFLTVGSVLVCFDSSLKQVACSALPASHWLCVNVLLNNITFLWF